MRSRLPDLFLLLGFVVIIITPLFGAINSPESIFQPGTPFQQGFSIKQIIKTYLNYPADFNSYFGTHYFLYNWQVSVLQAVRYHLLHETIFPNVLIGKEDWLFYTGEGNIDDYQCTSPFTDNELETIRQKLLDWDEQLEKRGIPFYFVIAPNKETIYPQYLPDRIEPLPKACRIDQVMSNLRTDPRLSVLDLRSYLQAASLSDLVYHRTDTHWNDLGALFATQQVISLLRKNDADLRIPSLDDYQQTKQPFKGDLAAFLPADDRFMEEETALLSRSSAVSLDEGVNSEIISSISGSNLPSLMIFRDSFADALIPFLSESFSRVVFVRSFSLDFYLIDREKPDIVIYEIAQRYLTVLR